MGQYFRFYLSNGIEEKVLNPYSYNTLAKLTEHSYVGNTFCNAAVSVLMQLGPSVVYHLGDYADEDPDFDKDIFRTVWGDENGYTEFHPANVIHSGQIFIKNDAKKQYIRYVFSRPPEGTDYLNTFALLTAFRNTDGGSYHGRNEHLVGTWAGDVLEATEEEPEGYRKIHGWVFKE